MDFLEAEKYREAIEEFKKALEIKDTDYEIWNNMGVVYGRLGERDEAIKCYEKAVELNPANAQVVNNLENSYFEREQYEKVIELSDKVLKKEPKNLIALFFKGKTYLALKRPSEAILWLQKAQKIEPKDTEVIEQLAWSYYSAGKFTESSKYMEQARKLGSREFIKELRWIEIFSKRPVTSSVESVMFGIVTSLLLIIFVLGILGIDFIFKWSEPQHAHFSEEEKQKPTRLVRSVTIISIVLGVLVIDQIGKSLALAYYTRFSEPLHSLGIKSLQGLIMSFFGVIRLSHIIEFGKNLALHSVVNMTTIMVLLLISVACIINIRFYERIGQFNNEEPQFKKKIAKTLFGIVEKFIYVVFFIPVLIISAVIDGAYFIVTKTVGLFYKGKSTGKYVSISEKKRLAKKPFKVSLLYYIVVSFGMGCTLSVSCDLLLGRAGVVDYLPFKIGLANFGDFVLLLLLCYFLELVKNGIVKVFRRFNKPEVRHKLKKFFYNLELSGIFRKKYSGRF
jgi:tetratricopeptide (TPR) repeat protein